MVTPNEMVTMLLWWSAKPTATFFVWFVCSTRIFLVKPVYKVLESSNLSARKILVLDQKDPSVSELDKENIRRYSRTPLFRSPKGNGKQFEITGEV